MEYPNFIVGNGEYNNLLDFIKDKGNVLKIQKGDYLVIDYVLGDGYLFVGNPYGIECRGITFDSDGNCVSRPLEKFFNLGEGSCPISVEEALALKMDDYTVYEKLDGSMIAISLVGDELLIKTRKSLDNEQATDVRRYLNEHGYYQRMVNYLKYHKGLTLIFEWTAPQNVVVVPHTEEKLTLLAIRNNTYGYYIELHSFFMSSYGVTSVEEVFKDKVGLESVDIIKNVSIKDLMERLKTEKGTEGYVVRTKGGVTFKLKNDWYCSLHKSLSYFRERDIAELVVNEGIDDIKAHLTQNGIDVSGIEKIESAISSFYKECVRCIEEYINPLRGKEIDFKSLALSIKPEHKPMMGLIMSTARGKEINIKEYILKTKIKSFSLNKLPIERL